MRNPELDAFETITALNLAVMSDALHLAAYAIPTQSRDATWQVHKGPDGTVLRQADMGVVLENAIFETTQGVIISSIHVAKGGYLDREEDAAQRAVLLRHGAEPRIFRTTFTPDNWRYNFKKMAISHGQPKLGHLLVDDDHSSAASFDELEKTTDLLRHLQEDLRAQEAMINRSSSRKFGIFPVRAV